MLTNIQGVPSRFPTFDRTQHASTRTDFAKILHKQTTNTSLETYQISDISIEGDNIYSTKRDTTEKSLIFNVTRICLLFYHFHYFCLRFIE